MSSRLKLGKVYRGILFSLVAAAAARQGLWPPPARAQAEWEKIVQGAKAEGKLAIGVPASAELRKSVEEAFKARFPAVELELIQGRGPANATRIMVERRAGVRHMNLLISGTATSFGIMESGLADSTEAYMVLPEVKDPKHWWGGHMYIDNAKRYIYCFQAYQTENQWYNTTLMKPEDVRSYDDLLDPRWKGKIGYLDPRTPGSGTATWAFLWKQKGSEYLKKLAEQDLFISTDQRQLADSLAKGKLALVVGITYYTLLPHVKAGLPVKPLPSPREGQYTTCGSGAITMLKSPPQPNATRVFLNWLLSKEGQELYDKAMGQATRRLDVDTKWLPAVGVKASKDFLTLEEHERLENSSEATVRNIWDPATEFAKKILK